MTTQLVNNLNVVEVVANLATSDDAPRLVNSLTVDELKEVIANVVDARLNRFFNSLNTNGAKQSSEVESNELNIKSQTLSSNNYEDKLESTEVKTENPWLKMAGLHKDNPLFEEVVTYIEANRQNDFVEELS
ncbi:hypothetical protein [Pseudanabaena sp. ABRG5-3]|jgi:hypothetical protein|uniref:hypothetical protein n=1 Tax=Pseudanabaena sp. ABRG5-3 TaxID=685565 RepID=UPI000DC70D97|nr:hypothetical protein [Pseudanabaena sp. ABRG5-3]BBC23001.1 hypothetical protein ABRG53_0744 [Pseudanabaena sp. ABRG5-3]